MPVRAALLLRPLEKTLNKPAPRLKFLSLLALENHMCKHRNTKSRHFDPSQVTYKREQKEDTVRVQVHLHKATPGLHH